LPASGRFSYDIAKFSPRKRMQEISLEDSQIFFFQISKNFIKKLCFSFLTFLLFLGREMKSGLQIGKGSPNFFFLFSVNHRGLLWVNSLLFTKNPEKLEIPSSFRKSLIRYSLPFFHIYVKAIFEGELFFW